MFRKTRAAKKQKIHDISSKIRKTLENTLYFNEKNACITRLLAPGASWRASRASLQNPGASWGSFWASCGVLGLILSLLEPPGAHFGPPKDLPRTPQGSQGPPKDPRRTPQRPPKKPPRTPQGPPKDPQGPPRPKMSSKRPQEPQNWPREAPGVPQLGAHFCLEPPPPLNPIGYPTTWNRDPGVHFAFIRATDRKVNR